VTVTESDILADFDLLLEPPCEHTDHTEIGSSGPAKYVIRVSACPACSDPPVLVMTCDDCYRTGIITYLSCDCGYCAPAHDWWTIVNVL
jgi:hypothetical protein